MKKILGVIILSVLMLIAGKSFGVSPAGYYYYWFTIVDEQGNICTQALDIKIQVSSTNIVAYKGPAGSTYWTDSNDYTWENLEGGYVWFWAKYATVDVVITDGSNTLTRSGITGSDNKLLFSPEGWTMTSLTITGALTAGGTITGNGDWVIGNAITDGVAIAGAIQGASPLYFDGATDDTNEVLFKPLTDPSADKTVSFPSLNNGTLMISTLTTNDVDVANSIWGASNVITFEGATANTSETTLSVDDPTADNAITLPDDTGSLSYTPTGKTTKDASNAAIPITHAIVEATSGAASAWSLPNGKKGQILTVAIVTDGGEATITPATATGWATAVLTDDKDTITVMYVDDTVGWIVLGTASDGTNLVAITQ